MSKAMSLKAKIRNIAKQKNIPAQVILQNYMFERLLVRLSASEYKEKFVLKGGMLVAAIVGLDNLAERIVNRLLYKYAITFWVMAFTAIARAKTMPGVLVSHSALGLQLKCLVYQSRTA